jgi:hypothetical protein
VSILADHPSIPAQRADAQRGISYPDWRALRHCAIYPDTADEPLAAHRLAAAVVRAAEIAGGAR